MVRYAPAHLSCHRKLSRDEPNWKKYRHPAWSCRLPRRHTRPGAFPARSGSQNGLVAARIAVTSALCSKAPPSSSPAGCLHRSSRGDDCTFEISSVIFFSESNESGAGTACLRYGYRTSDRNIGLQARDRDRFPARSLLICWRREGAASPAYLRSCTRIHLKTRSWPSFSLDTTRSIGCTDRPSTFSDRRKARPGLCLKHRSAAR